MPQPARGRRIDGDGKPTVRPAGRIAGEVGRSHRHLIARFRQQVGLRPKSAARLIRFDRVCRSIPYKLRSPGLPSLAKPGNG